jgi:hypothetical protein
MTTVIKELDQEDLEELAINLAIAQFAKKNILVPNAAHPRWEKLDIQEEPVIREIDLGNCTMFTITAFFCNPILSGVIFNMPRFFVSIEKKGSFLFNPENVKYPKYVAEKLNLYESDAAIIADWINIQLGIEAKEFGWYETTAIVVKNPEYCAQNKKNDLIKLIFSEVNGLDISYSQKRKLISSACGEIDDHFLEKEKKIEELNKHE